LLASRAMLSKTLVDTVPKQLPVVLPWIRYGSAPAVPGGLPRTCWALPGQMRQEWICTASPSDHLRNASTDSAPKPLLLHAPSDGHSLLDVSMVRLSEPLSTASSGQDLTSDLTWPSTWPSTADSCSHSSTGSVVSRAVGENDMQHALADLRTTKRRCQQQLLDSITRASHWEQRAALRAWRQEVERQQLDAVRTTMASLQVGPCSELSTLKKKLGSTRRAQVFHAQQRQAKNSAHLILRAWSVACSEAKSEEKLAVLQHQVVSRMESLHRQARMQRVSQRMQASRQLKRTSFRAWANAKPVGKRSTTASVQAKPQKLQSAVLSTMACAACKCGATARWGCSCCRVYPGSLLLAHRELSISSTIGHPIPDLEADSAFHLTADAPEFVPFSMMHPRTVADSVTEDGPSVAPPPGLEHVTPLKPSTPEVSEPDFHLRPRGVWAEKAVEGNRSG